MVPQSFFPLKRCRRPRCPSRRRAERNASLCRVTRGSTTWPMVHRMWPHAESSLNCFIYTIPHHFPQLIFSSLLYFPSSFAHNGCAQGRAAPRRRNSASTFTPSTRRTGPCRSCPSTAASSRTPPSAACTPRCPCESRVRYRRCSTARRPPTLSFRIPFQPSLPPHHHLLLPLTTYASFGVAKNK